MWSIFGQKAGSILSALVNACRAATNVVITFFGVGLGVATVYDIRADRIVIEPLSVPHKLEDDGYSGAIVSQRLLRQVQAIVESADTLLREPTGDGGAARRITFSNEEALATLATIQVPSSGLSIRSASAIFRDVLRYPERKITGEITIKRSSRATDLVYSIILQLPNAASVEVEHPSIDRAISLAAQSIAQQFNPLGLAAFYYKEEKKPKWEEEKGLIEGSLLEERKKQRRENWERVDQIADNLIENEGAKLRKEGLFLRAIVLREMEYLDDAIYYFQKAAKEDGTFSDAYNGWAAVLVDKGNIPDALAVYDKARKANKDNPETFRNIALAYKSAGNIDQAIVHFEKATEGPKGLNDVDVFFQLGIAYETGGRFVDAVKAYDKVLKLQPRHAWALNNRCYNKAMLDDTSAIVDCNAALRLRIKEPAFYDGRGFAHLMLGQLKEAVDDYNTALSLYPKETKLPDQAYSLFGRGVAKQMQGNTAAGDADIAAAKQLKDSVEKEMSRLNVVRLTASRADARKAAP